MPFVIAAVQTVLAMVVPNVTEANSRVWDLYTAAGWIAALLGVVNLLLFMPCVYKVSC